jgi:hypothetical protein
MYEIHDDDSEDDDDDVDCGGGGAWLSSSFVNCADYLDSGGYEL